LNKAAIETSHGGDEMWGALGYAYARSGDKQDAFKMLSQLKELEKHSKRAAFDVAVVEIGLGKKDEALAWLETAYQEHNDDGLLTLKIDPIFDLCAQTRAFRACCGA